MGDLYRLPLKQLVTDYDINIFVETGTDEGKAVKFALQHDFDMCYSVELLESAYQKCLSIFKDNSRVKLIHDNSINGVKTIISEVPADARVLYWLDAHLPDYYDTTYGKDYSNTDIMIPLEEELKSIMALRDISNDIFLIDDLRIYELGDYGKGNWTAVIDMKLSDGAKFVDRLLGETHDITRDYRDEGYIICIPKK